MNPANPASITFQPPPDSRPNVYDLGIEKLAALVTGWGEPAYRARQILHWLYRELVTDFSQMTNLPVNLRRRLAEHLRIGSARLVTQKISSDGWTRKVLLEMRDGATIEAVLMLYYDRATVCVSSQVGCAMGCSFCATGQMGFTRNLTAGEILEQVLWFNRWLRQHPHRPPVPRDGRPRYHGRPVHMAGAAGARRHHDAHRNYDVHHAGQEVWHINDGAYVPGGPREINSVTNIVFMGMGEPLVNYNNLWKAIRTINSPQGLALGARRMTVSTVGIVPQIRRFAHEDLPVNLAVSLHAPDDELRSRMVPINLHYPISELMDACREYIRVTHRRITFEYVLIRGVNDSPEQARRLAELLRGMLCHVNLIPLNPVPGTGMQATPRRQVFAFQKVLEEAGISTTVRIERGVDIAAACGQLKVEHEPGSHHRSLNPELVQAHVQADLASTL